MKYFCKIIEYKKIPGSPCNHEHVQNSIKSQILLAESEGDKIIAKGDEISLVNSEGVCEWEKPLQFPGRPNEVFISQDRLLLTTLSLDYHAWGFLGPAFLVDKNDGSVIAELRGETAAALKDGSFILGLEGYDFFNTWLYDRHGNLLREWRSYGHYIVGDDDDIRVLERDRRIPTKSRVVRLKFDGTIDNGPELKEAQVSKPLILKDKAILFVDRGIIRIVDLSLKDQFRKVLMSVSQHDSWRFHSNLNFEGDNIKVDIFERTEEPPIEYTKQSWQLELTYKP